MRLTTSWVIAAAFLCAACTEEAQEPVPQAFKGISVATGGQVTIFVGSAANADTQLQESLAGIEKNEQWYRFQLPEHLMPATDSALVVDLANNPNVAATVRLSNLAPMPVNQVFFHTMVLGPSETGTSGNLRIIAPKASEPQSTWAVSMSAVRTGPVVLGGKTYSEWESHIELSIAFNPLLKK